MFNNAWSCPTFALISENSPKHEPTNKKNVTLKIFFKRENGIKNQQYFASLEDLMYLLCSKQNQQKLQYSR
jgi:hypothetical protein